MRASLFLLLVLAASACGADRRAGDPSRLDGSSSRRYAATAKVLESPEHGPELCLGVVMGSYPPQCSGVPLANWSWDDAEGHEAAHDTRWGEYNVEGTYDGEVFTLTQPPAPPTPASGAGDDFPTPCAPPAGGWTAPDPSRASEQAVSDVAVRVRAEPDFAGLWVAHLDPSPPGEEPDGQRRFVLNVAFTADLERHEREIREVWGGPLCVSKHERTYAELQRIQADLMRSGARALGLKPLLAEVDEVRNVVTLSVVLANDHDREAIDEQYGDGAVEVTSALRPVTSS